LGFFEDDEDVYRIIGRLNQELMVDPELGPRFQRANTTVQYLMHDPEAVITIDLHPDAEPRVDLGPSDLDPEVVMEMQADTAHLFWLGKVNVTVAIARGEIKASGPVAKILRLIPVAKLAFPRYSKMLEEAGRADLLETIPA
jgi:hypothetical protein